MSEQIIIKQEPADGMVQMVIVPENGRVIQRFERATEFVAYDAQNAIDVAMHMMDMAYEARGDLKPADGVVKHGLVERHRKTLMKRYELVLNTLREHKKSSNHDVAKALLDIALAEIF